MATSYTPHWQAKAADADPEVLSNPVIQRAGLSKQEDKCTSIEHLPVEMLANIARFVAIDCTPSSVGVPVKISHSLFKMLLLGPTVGGVANDHLKSLLKKVEFQRYAKIKLPQHSLYLLASVFYGPKCNFNGLVTGVEVCIYRTLPHSITRREFDEFSDEWIEDLSHVKQSQLFEDNARKSGPQEALFASLDDADMLKSIPVLFDCMQTPFDFRIVQPEVSDLADGYNLVEAFTGREDMPQNSDKDIVGKLLLNLPAHRVSKLYTTAFGDAFDYYLMDPDYLHAPAIVHIHQFPTALTSLHICWDHHDHYMFFRDWVDFLKCTPSLQTLRLQDAGCSSSEILIQHVLTETLLPSLNKLILQDLEFEPTDLFVFIKDNKESLRNLKLIGSCFRHSDEVRKFLVFYTRRAYLDRRLSWTITEYEKCWDPGFLHEFREHIKICSDDDIEGQLRDVGGWVNHVPGRDNW